MTFLPPSRLSKADGLHVRSPLVQDLAAADQSALFESIFASSPVPMCTVQAATGVVIALNDAWVLATGVARASVVSEGLAAYGASLTQALLAVSALGSGPLVDVVVWEVPQPRGESLSVRLKVKALAHGAPPLWLLTMDRAEALSNPLGVHEGLRQQAELQPAIERLARVGHWTVLEGSDEVDWSPGLYEIAGFPPRAVIPRQEGRSGIHPDDYERWSEAREALDGRDVAYRWRRPDGVERWLRTRMGRSEAVGAGVLAFGVVQDITEERNAQLALGAELGFINNIAAHVPGAIYRARRDKEGLPSVSFVSPSALDVLGVDAADVMRDQRVFFRHIIPEDLPALLALMDRTCADLSALRAVFRADVPGRGRRWIQAEATTQREADGATVWHGFLTDVTDHLLATKALERQHRLLQAVQKAQATFIEVDDKRRAFDGLLASFLSVTESTFGFVGEVLYGAQAQPYLRMQAITNIGWDEASRQAAEATGEKGMEFHSLKTLFGHALKTGQTVISNDPDNDPRAGGLPPGHPPLSSFLAVPISVSGKLVAMVGLANKPEGYDAAEVAFLRPLLGTVLELVMAARAHAEQRRSRLQFQATSALLVEKSSALQATFDSIIQGLIMVDGAGLVRFYNHRFLELLQLPTWLFADGVKHADIANFQEKRGDFGVDFSLMPSHLRGPEREISADAPPEQYVRRTADGQVIEVVTRSLPGGGFVRVFTDVTSYVDTQEALREERQRLEWVLEATRPGIWETNLETGETIYNERWAELLGYSIDELRPTTVHTWRGLVHPDDLGRATAQVESHLNGDAPYYEADLRMRHKNGHWRWVNDRGRVHRRDESGRALYMSGTLLDIHDRVAAQEEVHSLNASLERRVEERTAALERSMKDMETISYSIAHDLRAPLRSVNGFASLIAEEGLDQLSPEARRMFERIAHSSRNMGQMITDMLELLRVVRVELNAVPVDMNALAHSVSEALAPSVPHALIGIKPLPRVLGDATLLRQVLANLMDNALKYAKHLPQAELVLGFDEKQRAFYLRDNGMGFDMARAGKLFGLFQRMHAGSDVPGTGVGLAIVARIIERHGGRIWADAAPGKGATFWWTLPRG